jgi:glycine/D-amino acid oxidase-like deaminating enzyme
MSETAININAIIDEVAKRHHIRLAADDPVLATVTVTEIIHKLFAEHLSRLVEGVADQATDRLAAQIETARREVAAQTDASKAIASKLINDAGAWSGDQLKRASEGVAEDIRSAVSSALTTIQSDIRAARSARQIAVWAAAVALVVGALFLGGGIGFWLAGPS